MKKGLFVLLLPLVALTAILMLGGFERKLATSSTPAVSPRPNIIVIMADDMGFLGFGVLRG